MSGTANMRFLPDGVVCFSSRTENKSYLILEFREKFNILLEAMYDNNKEFPPCFSVHFYEEPSEARTQSMQ